MLPLYSPVLTDSLIPLGRAAIAKAHVLDATDANAFAAEGFCDILASQFREGDAAIVRALALDSSNVIANRMAWSVLAATGRVEDAAAAERRAMRFDPLSATPAWIAAQIMLIAKRYDEGIVFARRSVELDSVAAPGRLIYALILQAQGKTGEARKLLSASSSTSPQTVPWMGYLLAATGDRTGVANFTRQLETQRGHSSFVNLGEAWVYLGEGDTTRALDALEQAARAHEPIGFSVPFNMPAYDALRHSARFAAVIKGYGLDPATFNVVSAGSSK